MKLGNPGNRIILASFITAKETLWPDVENVVHRPPSLLICAEKARMSRVTERGRATSYSVMIGYDAWAGGITAAGREYKLSPAGKNCSFLLK